MVEIFMPKVLRGLMGFYLTWAGKGIFYILIGVILLIPFSNKIKLNGDKIYIFFIVVAIYLFVMAAFLLVLGILSALGTVSVRSSSIVTKSESSSSSKKTTTTKTSTLNETLVEEN